jgi:N-acetylmuramoyl-L-alanine amidase
VKKRKAWIRSFFFISSSLFVILSLFVTPTGATAPQEIHQGSQGVDVWKLQKRLYALGLYDGQINGIADSKTMEAIRLFQRVNGQKGTGRSSRPAQSSLSEKELDLLTRLVYAESRGEPYEGQVAVAAVVLNRVESPHFPDTVRDVIFQRGAFSVVRHGQLPKKTSEQARRAVLDAARGIDPSKGALYFYNPDISSSEWIFTRPRVTEIGNHVFAR